MAGATQKPKLGNVTVATVKRREQARQICARLEAAGIQCFLQDERGGAAGAITGRLGGINVLVSRGDVARALQLLQRKDDGMAVAGRQDRVPSSRPRFRLQVDGRIGTLVQVLALLTLAVLLARAVFY